MAHLIPMPSVVADASEATLQRWLVGVGDEVGVGTPIADLETEKATVELEADADGTVARLLVDEGDAVAVGAGVAVLRQTGDAESAVDELVSEKTTGKPDSEEETSESGAADREPPAVRGTEEPAAEPAAAEAAPRRFASPLARKLARDNALDLSQVVGSGPDGRIIRQDVEAAVEAAKTSVVSPDAASKETEVSDSGRRIEPVSRMRQAIARRLTESKTTIPHFYLSVDVRMDALLEMRTNLNAAMETYGLRATVNDLLLRALASALVEVPEANVSWTDDGIRRFDSVDVAVAVATEGGLLTPVVRDVAGRGIRSLCGETADIKERAASGGIRQEELEGGSFTVSNLGMYGVRDFAAIINPPQAGIVAFGEVAERVVVEEGEIGVAQMMTATLSADHRVIDGSVGARLMAAFRHKIEQPMALMV